MRRTKIVCTLGPATASYEKIKQLATAGMNVARLNFSHGTTEQKLLLINHIKKVREELQIPLGILLDTKGPEIRLGDIPDLEVFEGMKIRLVKKVEKEKDIPIVPAFVLDQFQVNMEVLFDDGYVVGKVSSVGEGFVEVEIQNAGVIKRQKGVNLPGQTFNLPDMTEQDIKDIEFGCDQGVEMIAASFINHARQVLAIKDLLERKGKSHIMVIAKIESREGVKNFDEILEVSDGIMVARGDLGVELFVGLVPPLQKKMIRACNLRSKIVITATQMLESMIHCPTPTRAEASDVANAIYDATSAVMLSGETAAGKYPVETVKMMDKIVCEAEKDFDYINYFQNDKTVELQNIPTAMARAAVHTSYSTYASAIIACSRGGHTVRRLSRFRPRALIIVITPSDVTYHQTSVMWGTCAYMEQSSDPVEGFKQISCFALQKGWVNYGDIVVLTNGKPYGVSFTTNTLMVQSIGDVLVKGSPMPAADVIQPVLGEIAFLLTHVEGEGESLDEKIVVAARIDEKDLLKMEKAKGVILQNHPIDKQSVVHLEALYKSHKVPYIYYADGATFLLAKGQKVRLHPQTGLVFKGDSPTEEEMRVSCSNIVY